MALSAGGNIDVLAAQVKQFRPELVSVKDAAKIPELLAALGSIPGYKPAIMAGDEGIVAVAEHPSAEAVVTGIVGCAGLRPTVAAINKGKDICLANKETLIAGGPFVLPLAAKKGVAILPADSEHSAIFQCIQGLPVGGMRRIILTASGGAFRDWPVDKLKEVKVADALKHPNWSMGRKITVDSATLKNKARAALYFRAPAFPRLGPPARLLPVLVSPADLSPAPCPPPWTDQGLEVIEAHYLFGANYDHIDIVIHPQSIIHSMVETADSSVIAQLGWPDMRLPILYTMSWPERVNCSEKTWPRLNFTDPKCNPLTFKEPDRVKYPSIALSYGAGRAGGTMTGVLSAANEQAVELFLNESIGYLDIPRVIEAACTAHRQEHKLAPSLEEIVHFDGWARR